MLLLSVWRWLCRHLWPSGRGSRPLPPVDALRWGRRLVSLPQVRGAITWRFVGSVDWKHKTRRYRVPV